MQIEQTYLKSITIKNHLLQQKSYYLLLCCNRTQIIVGPVFLMKQNNQQKSVTWNNVNFKISKIDLITVQLWQYEEFKRIAKINVDLCELLTKKCFIFEEKMFSIDMKCKKIDKSQSQAKIDEQETQKMQHRKHLIFPLIKTLDTMSNSRKRNFSSNIYKSQLNCFQREYSPIDSAFVSETSLERIMQFSSQGSNLIQEKNGKSVKLKSNKYKQSQKDQIICFDDYETISIKQHQKQQKRKQLSSYKKQQQKRSKEAYSTDSSSLVKKNLKNTIIKLTSNPRNIQRIQTSSKCNKSNENQSCCWLFDYGMNGSQRGQKKEVLKRKKNQAQEKSNIYEFSGMQSFCEKSLSKDEIKSAEKMNSFELSQSIFQMYGLDLSLSKNKDKPKERTKISSKELINKKESKDTKCKERKRPFNNDQSFQDYGQHRANRNSQTQR